MSLTVELLSLFSLFQKYFEFPQDIDDVSDAAKDLIRKLICPAAQRLGSNNLEEVKNHPFFEGIEWDNIRDSK